MKRILLVKLGAIGDVVMTIPAVHALQVSGHQIDWVVSSSSAAVLECYSICRIIRVDERAIMQGTFRERIRALRAVWACLANSYDVVVTLYYDRRYRLISLPVRAALHVRLDSTDRTFTLQPGRHHTDEFARILFAATQSDFDDVGPRPQSLVPVVPDCLPLSPLTQPQSKRVVLAPGGAKNLLRDDVLRRWPVELYVELGRRLLSNGYEVVITGGPGDLWVREAFAGMHCIDLIDRMTLPQLLSLFNQSDAVVTHDSGPLHLAGVTGCALVGIFGPVNPWERLPRRPGALALWGGEGFACRPCYNGKYYAICTDNRCMAQVTSEMAFSAVEDLLQQRARGAMCSPEVRMPYSTASLVQLEPQSV